VQVRVIDEVPDVGLMVSYAPKACVVAPTVQVFADHATEHPKMAQAAMHASSALDLG